MSRKYLTNIDLTKNELQNARSHNLAAAPSSPGLGQRYFDTTLNAEYVWNGTAWISTDAALRSAIPLANLTTDPLARANHTGTQTAASVSDLASTVKAYRLDEFAAPTSDVALNTRKITGLGEPTLAQDAATKNYVDVTVQSAAAGIDTKASCRVVAPDNIALSGLSALDGITLLAGDRVLVVGQALPAQNGVYSVASGAWTRTTDADDASELTPGAFWFILFSSVARPEIAAN